MSAAAAKERTERNTSWNAAQQKRRSKAKTARALAKTSRDNMASEKAAAGATMRAEKQGLKTEHKERMQQEYLSKAAAVKQVIAEKLYNESEATGSPGGGAPKPPSPESRGASGRPDSRNSSDS